MASWDGVPVRTFASSRKDDGPLTQIKESARTPIAIMVAEIDASRLLGRRLSRAPYR